MAKKELVQGMALILSSIKSRAFLKTIFIPFLEEFLNYFMIRSSIDYFKFEPQRSNFEFCDQLIINFINEGAKRVTNTAL
jgi:hypothetical protein